MSKHNQTVTNGNWSVSATSGSGIDGYRINVAIPRDGIRDKRSGFGSTFQRGDIDGMVVRTHDDYKRICLEKGYTRLYSRNLNRFVMTRAARKRGMVCNDMFYLMAVRNAEAARAYAASL